MLAGTLVLGCWSAQAGGAAPFPAPAHAGGSPDLTDAALLASGYEESRARQRARETLERWIGPLVRTLPSVRADRARAEQLLVALHRKGGPLGRYDMRATTLKDILQSRRYNCVSASVLYNLIAHRVGLAVGAQLLPTHARSLLSAQREGRLERVVIETTSEAGFDPSPEEEAAILDQVAAARSGGGRALVSEDGVVVSSRVLVGTIYVNRASIAQERGDYELAERLFARGEVFVADRRMGRLLREQRIALLSQLAADDLLSDDEARFARAYQTLLAAGRLGPGDPEIRAVLQHNLRAAAERIVSEAADSRGESAVWAAVEEVAGHLAREHQEGLRAFAWSEVGRRRVATEHYEGAVEAYDRGLRLCAGIADEPLVHTLVNNRIATLRLAAFRVAKRGNYVRGWALLARAAETAGSTEHDTRRLEEDAERVIHLAAGYYIDAGAFDAALRAYRAGLERFPGDEAARHNLVAVLERRVGGLVDASGCQRAERHLRELESVAPESTFARGIRIRCLLERARERLRAGDHERARALIEQARVLEPDDAPLRRNLAVALASWVRALARTGACARAREVAAELEGLSVPDVGPRTVRAALATCGGRGAGRR